MLRLMLAALVLLFHVSLASANPIPDQCLGEKSLRDVLSAQVPDAELVTFAGTDAVNFIAAFNALPPVSQVGADVVLVITLSHRADAALAFFAKGCLVARGMMPRAQLEQLQLQLQRGDT